MTIVKNRLMTLDEYLAYEGQGGCRYELENGILIEMAPENPINNTIVMFLVSQLSQLGIDSYRFASGHGLQVDSAVASSRIPDLVVHSEESIAAILKDGGLLRLGSPAPDLVVETVSSSDQDKRSRDRDYILKRKEYALRGIPEYWIIDPVAGCVVIHRLSGIDYIAANYINEQTLISELFPTLGLSVQQLLTAGVPNAEPAD